MTRQEKSEALFLEGFNCSQSVFTAFCDLFDIDENTAKKISAGLGGGVGRLREVCGAVSASAMVLGYITAATEGSDSDTKQKNYELVREFTERFTALHGSIICRDALALASKPEYSPKPDERNAEYYKNRPCLKIVSDAAAILEDMIKEYTGNKV